MSALILMYHGVGDEVAPHAELRYTVDEQSFALQLEALASHPAAGLGQLLPGEAPDRAVVWSFDDGEKSVVTRALPLLQARGWRGVLFMTTGWIGEPGYCDEADLQRLAEAGWEIGAHGVSHRFLSELDDAELQAELREARARLREILGRDPEHLSLPGGRGDRRVRAAAIAAGYRTICTSIVGRNARRPDPLGLRRVMVQRGDDAGFVRHLAAGDQRLLLELRARQELLDAAKRLLGNRRYVALRATLGRLLGR